ncbi:MAG: hypothetical protein A3K19_06560 [Lentisphaerae bacterium RIFOXYB12_FULL_65_16]|nr:MAG: hypothetical protein A3K18_02080 [Lentisphaerae bacterium RIFOXYA12_64_32]OGV93100.1 MAG: hypothetical protein A3K19_06560 [Lentisphaerae bacterium RIFOXYB12_FULL_65_16]
MTAIQVLQSSAEELQRRAEEHRRLIAAAIDGGDVKGVLDVCGFLDCPHRRRLRETLVEAIAVLEETRRAFKSKQLEVLRKKLIGVLAENA